MAEHQKAFDYYGDGFDAEGYWATREFKKYKVILSVGSGKKEKTDSLLIQARNVERAVACAQRHTMLKGRTWGRAYLAHPRELGCTITKH